MQEPMGPKDVTPRRRAIDTHDALRRELDATRSRLHALEQERGRLLAQNQSLIGRLDRDPMTGLFTPVAFREILRDRCAERNHLAVLFLDMNGLKRINDTHGHAAGDFAILETARRMTEVLRYNDRAARLGGDEFGVLIVGPRRRSEVESVIQRICEAVAAPAFFTPPTGGPQIAIALSLSIGAALSTGDALEGEELLAEADAAMYRAKAGALCHAFAGEDGADRRASRAG